MPSPRRAPLPSAWRSTRSTDTGAPETGGQRTLLEPPPRSLSGVASSGRPAVACGTYRVTVRRHAVLFGIVCVLGDGRVFSGDGCRKLGLSRETGKQKDAERELIGGFRGGMGENKRREGEGVAFAFPSSILVGATKSRSSWCCNLWGRGEVFLDAWCVGIRGVRLHGVGRTRIEGKSGMYAQTRRYAKMEIGDEREKMVQGLEVWDNGGMWVRSRDVDIGGNLTHASFVTGALAHWMGEYI